jgi:hypothetical protein
MAQSVRFAISLLACAAAALIFLAIKSPWMGALAALTVFAAGSGLAEAVFRRLASREEIRADLEDRVRNPPD